MWFEKLDFEENPFKIEEKELIGYEEIIDEMLYRISSGSLVFIKGKEGSGKTVILKKAIEKYRGNGKVAYIECKKVEDPNIEKVILKKYGIVRRLFSKKPRNMILLMDDIQELSKKNNERVKYFFDQNYIRSAVFTGNSLDNANFSDSLKDRISKVLEIKELNEEEGVEIIESIFQGKEVIPEEIIKRVFRLSNKNIKLFLENCEKLCENMAGEKVTEEDFTKLFGEVKEKKSKPRKVKEKIPEEIVNPIEDQAEEDIAERFY